MTKISIWNSVGNTVHLGAFTSDGLKKLREIWFYLHVTSTHILNNFCISEKFEMPKNRPFFVVVVCYSKLQFSSSTNRFLLHVCNLFIQFNICITILKEENSYQNILV